MSQIDIERLNKGIALFNSGEFFEAHEQWEKIWRRMEDGSEKRFIQGLIKITAAFVHYTRGEFVGTAMLIENGTRLLDYAGTGMFGIDIGNFLGQVDRFYEKFKASEKVISDRDLPHIQKC